MLIMIGNFTDLYYGIRIGESRELSDYNSNVNPLGRYYGSSTS